MDNAMKNPLPKLKGLVGNFGNWQISKKLLAAIAFFTTAVGISVGIAADQIGSSTVQYEFKSLAFNASYIDTSEAGAEFDAAIVFSVPVSL